MSVYSGQWPFILLPTLLLLLLPLPALSLLLSKDVLQSPVIAEYHHEAHVQQHSYEQKAVVSGSVHVVVDVGCDGDFGPF